MSLCGSIVNSFLSVTEYYSTVWIYHGLLICSLFNECLDCFQFGAVSNKTGMKILVKVFVLICFHIS